jgi:hypothetical protein
MTVLCVALSAPEVHDRGEEQRGGAVEHSSSGEPPVGSDDDDDDHFGFDENLEVVQTWFNSGSGIEAEVSADEVDTGGVFGTGAMFDTGEAPDEGEVPDVGEAPDEDEVPDVGEETEAADADEMFDADVTAATDVTLTVVAGHARTGELGLTCSPSNSLHRTPSAKARDVVAAITSPIRSWGSSEVVQFIVSINSAVSFITL